MVWLVPPFYRTGIFKWLLRGKPALQAPQASLRNELQPAEFAGRQSSVLPTSIRDTGTRSVTSDRFTSALGRFTPISQPVPILWLSARNSFYSLRSRPLTHSPDSCTALTTSAEHTSSEAAQPKRNHWVMPTDQISIDPREPGCSRRTHPLNWKVNGLLLRQ